MEGKKPTTTAVQDRNGNFHNGMTLDYWELLIKSEVESMNRLNMDMVNRSRGSSAIMCEFPSPAAKINQKNRKGTLRAVFAQMWLSFSVDSIQLVALSHGGWNAFEN